MYAGHFAAGLAIKGRVPDAPTWGLLAGVGALDILFGPFVLAGIERASLTPGVSPGFSLDYIDWSHSLLMSIVWSLAFAALFIRRGRTVAVAMGVAVFSHFVLDVVVHPADMALWPNASVHLGLGLWRVWPKGWWFVELAVVAAGVSYYWKRSLDDRSFGARVGSRPGRAAPAHPEFAVAEAAVGRRAERDLVTVLQKAAGQRLGDFARPQNSDLQNTSRFRNVWRLPEILRTADGIPRS
jgi:hypothetical protein